MNHKIGPSNLGELVSVFDAILTLLLCTVEL